MPKPKLPNEDQSKIVTEILNLVESFRREIPAGRTAWPACIRERVFSLAKSGMSFRQISIATAIPYDTIVAWPVRRVMTETGFHELQVVQNKRVDVGTVTVPVPKSNLIFCLSPCRIEGLSIEQVKELLRDFGGRL